MYVNAFMVCWLPIVHFFRDRKAIIELQYVYESGSVRVPRESGYLGSFGLLSKETGQSAEVVKTSKSFFLEFT